MDQKESKKLLRSQKDRIFAGVCGGLGEFFDIDPVIIRLLFVLLFFAGGSSLLAYIILWLVIPESSKEDVLSQKTIKQNVQEIQDKSQEVIQNFSHNYPRSQVLIGIILLTVGAIFLLDNFQIFPRQFWSKLWPLALIFLGFVILARRSNKNG